MAQELLGALSIGGGSAQPGGGGGGESKKPNKASKLPALIDLRIAKNTDLY